jgi:hypothetical protein
VTTPSTQMKAHALAAATIIGSVVLYRFPPEAYEFYPRCPIFRFLHVICPGCGATRALAALLHGRIADALHYNALVVFLLPLFVAFCANAYISILRGQSFSWPQIPTPAVHVLLLATLVFAVFRNVAHLAL